MGDTVILRPSGSVSFIYFQIDHRRQTDVGLSGIIWDILRQVHSFPYPIKQPYMSSEHKHSHPLNFSGNVVLVWSVSARHSRLNE